MKKKNESPFLVVFGGAAVVFFFDPLLNFSTNASVPFLIYAVSSSTDLNHKCTIEE